MPFYKYILPLLLITTLSACTSPSTWEYAPPNISQVGYPKHPAIPAHRHNYYTLDNIYAVKPTNTQSQLWLNFTAHNNQNKNIKHLNLNYTVKINTQTGQIIEKQKHHPNFYNGQPQNQHLIAAFKPHTSPYATPKAIYYDPGFTPSQINKYLSHQQQKAINIAKQKNIAFRGKPFLILDNTLLTLNDKNHLYAYTLHTPQPTNNKPNIPTQTVSFDD